MNVDFIAVDFETANADMGSACSIGIALVEDLRIVDSFYSLIRPRNLYFEDANVRVHGITPDMVEQAPTLNELWPDIRGMFSLHCPVVAHNAHFDMSALRLSTDADIPDFPFVDSMRIASPIVSGSKSLSNCAKELCIDLRNHHNALDDAEACAEIAICGLRASDCIFMWEYLAKNPHVQVHHFADLEPQRTFRSKKARRSYPQYIRPSDIQRTVECPDRNNPLCGRTIVFTGELSISRDQAMQLAVDVGATVKTAVSRKVDYLVVGKQDISLVGDDGLSTKEERAYALNSEGKAQIKIIGESEFLSLAAGMEVV